MTYASSYTLYYLCKYKKNSYVVNFNDWMSFDAECNTRLNLSFMGENDMVGLSNTKR